MVTPQDCLSVIHSSNIEISNLRQRNEILQVQVTLTNRFLGVLEQHSEGSRNDRKSCGESENTLWKSIRLAEELKKQIEERESFLNVKSEPKINPSMSEYDARN